MDNSWENYTASGTVIVKPGKGVLKRIVVNTTAAGAITAYDNASAASGKKIATLKSNVAENSYDYDIPFVNGLTLNLAAASDITVVFK